jgi:hypothetical protein
MSKKAETHTHSHSTTHAPATEPAAASPATSASNPLDQAQALVKQIVAIVGPAPALTTKDRTRSLKLRKGGETVIPTVAALSDQFGLSVADYPTATMTSKAKKAASLIPLHKLLVETTKNVEDQMFEANSESWEAATAHYALLRRLSRTNGGLQTSLQPVRKFFATRSKAVVEAEDAKTGHKRGETKKSSTPAEATEAPGNAGSPVVAAAPVTPTAAPPSAVPGTVAHS